jgi:hypothetical protein
MNNDTKFIDRLDLLDRFEWSKEWKPKLAYLFGQGGSELNERISLLVPNGQSPDTKHLINYLDNALTVLSGFTEVTGEAHQLLKHACDRLGQILDQLEENML